MKLFLFLTVTLGFLFANSLDDNIEQTKQALIECDTNKATLTEAQKQECNNLEGVMMDLLREQDPTLDTSGEA